MQNPHQSGKRLLLVDDEVTLRTVISETLSDAGYMVDVAKNGKEALQVLGNKGHDLIISDINMPEMNGMDLYHEVEKNYPELKTKTLFLVGSPTDEILSFIKKNHCRYLTKPFKISDLVGQIKNILDNKGEKAA